MRAHISGLVLVACSLIALPSSAQDDVVFTTEENNSGSKTDSIQVWETQMGSLPPLPAVGAAGPSALPISRKPVARYIPNTNVVRLFISLDFSVKILEYSPNGTGTGSFVTLATFGLPPLSGTPQGLVVNDTLTRLYVGSGSLGYSSTLHEYDVSGLTVGATSQIVGPPLRSMPLAKSVISLTINPQGTRILGMDGSTSTDILDLDLSTGVSSVISTGADRTFGAIKIEPKLGCYAYFSSGRLNSSGNIDLTQRKIAVIDICSSNPGTIVNYVSITGAQDASGSPIDNLLPTDLDIDPVGDRAYFSTWPSGGNTSKYLLVLDNATGGGTNPHLTSTGSNYVGYSISVSPSTRRLYMTSLVLAGVAFNVFDIDPVTGDLVTGNAITTLMASKLIAGGSVATISPVLGVATTPRTLIHAKAVVTNAPADLTPVVSMTTTANSVTEPVAIGDTVNISTTSPQGTGLTTDPRYLFNGWVKDPTQCGDPSAITSLAIISDPASFPGPDTYCACFEKQWNVGVNITGSCTATLNGTTVANGSGIWVPEGTTVTGAAIPQTGVQITSVSGPVVADAAGKTIDIVCTSAPAVCAPQSNLASLVGWWSFEDTATISADRRGANNYLQPATTAGVVRATGYVGQALKLGAGGGGPAQVTAGSAPELDMTTNNFAIDAWIKFPQNSGPRSIADKFGGSSSGGGYSVLLSNGLLAFTMTEAGQPSTSAAWTTGGSRVDDDQWHHVAVVVRRSQATPDFYIDGVARTVTQTLGSMITASISSPAPLRVGGFNASTSVTDGLIDELEIFNAAITSQDIQEIIAAKDLGKCARDDKGCVPAPDGMVSWYKFEELAPIDLFNDSTTVNVGLKANGTITRNAAKVLQGVYLTAEDTGYLQAANATEHNFGSGDFSIDFWIRPQVNPVTRNILDKAAYSGLAFSSIQGYKAFLQTSGALSFDVGIGGAPRRWTGTKNLADNQWHHVTISVSRTASVNFYIDGVSDTLTANPAMFPTGSVDNTVALTVGRDNYPVRLIGANPPTAFWIDELEFFNRALTKTEADSIYLADTKGKCTPVPIPVCVPKASWQPGLVAWYGFEAAGATFVGDLSLTGNHGVVSTGATQSGGQVGDMLSVGSRYLEAPSSNSLNFAAAPFSADLWMRWSDRFANLSDAVLISKSSATTGWWFGLTQGTPACGTGAARLTFIVRDSAGTRQWNTACQALATASWRMVGFRYAPGLIGLNVNVVSFFIDGLPVTAASFTGSAAVPNLNNTSPLRVGSASWTTGISLPFTGDVDEVEIFNTGKPDSFFKQIFDAGAIGKCEKPSPLPPPATYTVTVVFQGCSSPVSFTSNPAATGNTISVAAGGNVSLTFTGASIATAVASPGGQLTLVANATQLTNVQGNTTITVTCGTPPAACYPINMNGMVAWYPLNETGLGNSVSHPDIAGINDSLLRSGVVTPTSAMVAGGQSFANGSFALTPSPSSQLNFGTGDFSVDAWISPANSFGGLIASKIGPPNLGGWYVALQPAGGGNLELELGVSSGGTGLRWYTQNANIPPNSFTHIAVVAQRNAQPAFYIDGVLFTGTIIASGGPIIPPINVDNAISLRLAGALPGATGYSGILDEVELFNRVLTAAEVSGIFAARGNGKCVPTCLATLPTGLRLWYGFDDISTGPATATANLAAAYVSVPNWTAGPQGSPSPTIVANGKHGQAAQFTTNTSYLESIHLGAGNPVSGSSPHTIDMWIKYPPSAAGATAARPIVDKMHVNSSAGFYKGYALYMQNGRLRYVGSDQTNSGVLNWDINLSAPALDDNQWHFIAVIAAPGNVPRFFIDGTSYGALSSQTLPTFAPVNKQKLRLGYLPGGPYLTNGIIDEFEFFGSALTDAQLDGIRNAGLGKCKLPVPCPAGSACSSGGVVIVGSGTYTFTGNILTGSIEVKNEGPVDAFSVDIHDIGVPEGYVLETPLPISVGDIPAGGSRRVTFRLRRTDDATGPAPTSFQIDVAGTARSGNTDSEFGFTAALSSGGSSTVNVTIATTPANAGLQFQAGPANALATYTNSVTLAWNAGGLYELRAPSPQLVNGRQYRFQLWAPSNNPSQNAQSIAAAGNTTYNAFFILSGYEVTLNNTGGCQLATTPAQSNPWIVSPGSTLTINSVTAPQGSQLNSFSIGTQTYSSFPVSVTVTEPITINANCGAAQNVTLTVATNPQGLEARIGATGAYAPAPLTQQVPAGQTQSISVTDNQFRNGTGYRFTNWSTGGSTPTTNVQPNSNFTATANFQTACHAITFNAQPSNAGTVTASPANGVTGFPAHCYAPGTVVTLTAAASTGFALQNWTGANGTGPTTTVIVNAPLTVTANFNAVQPPVIDFSLLTRTTGNLLMNARNSGGSAARNLTITSISNITATGATFVYTGFPGMQVPFVIPGGVSLAVGGNAAFNLLFTATAGSAATAFSFTITAQADNLPSFTQVVNIPGPAAPTAQASLALNAAGRINSGNTARLNFRIDNSGSAAAGSVTATLSVTGTQPLSVVQPQVSVGTIAAGGSANVTYSATSGPGSSIAESVFNVTLTVQYTQPGSTSPSQLTRTWQSQANGTFVQLQ